MYFKEKCDYWRMVLGKRTPDYSQFGEEDNPDSGL